ncbi:hypothetical protein [Pantoea ananatis]|nr:hypothetical protein [Pantoea ananatis]
MGTPKLQRRTTRAMRVFLCVRFSPTSMVGWAGQPKGWPGPL